MLTDREKLKSDAGLYGRHFGGLFILGLATGCAYCAALGADSVAGFGISALTELASDASAKPLIQVRKSAMNSGPGGQFLNFLMCAASV